jgi:hypothetical protein
MDWREEREKRRARSNTVDNQWVGKPMVQTLPRKRGKGITEKKEKLKKVKTPYFLFRPETKKLENKTSLCLRKNRKIISRPQKPKNQKIQNHPNNSKTNKTRRPCSDSAHRPVTARRLFKGSWRTLSEADYLVLWSDVAPLTV